MKKSVSCLFSFLLIALATHVYAADEIEDWPTYRGAWFDIRYPTGFKAHPSIKSVSATEGYDSVFFTSPDDTVEFYVFSPQWNGEPKDIVINPEVEEYISQNEEEKRGRRVRSVTLRAKDKSYFRSYVDIEDADHNTRVVFGIKYRNQEVYNKYEKAYLNFKKSLQQYAD